MSSVVFTQGAGPCYRGPAMKGPRHMKIRKGAAGPAIDLVLDADRARDIIREQGHTLSSAARAMGRSDNYLRVVLGRHWNRELELATVNDLANALGVSPIDILTTRPRKRRIPSDHGRRGPTVLPRGGKKRRA